MSTSYFENLPAELHMMILRSLIGFKSLSAVVHASPVMDSIYTAAFDKEELWTRVCGSTATGQEGLPLLCRSRTDICAFRS